MKKKLDTSGVMNELRGQSVFFPERKEEQTAQGKQQPTPPFVEQNKPRGKTNDTTIPRYHDTTIPKHHDIRVSSNHDTMVSLGDDGMIEEVRRAVKQVGKEPATQRLTLEEKQTLRSIEFTYGQQVWWSQKSRQFEGKNKIKHNHTRKVILVPAIHLCRRLIV